MWEQEPTWGWTWEEGQEHELVLAWRSVPVLVPVTEKQIQLGPRMDFQDPGTGFQQEQLSQS